MLKIHFKDTTNLFVVRTRVNYRESKVRASILSRIRIYILAKNPTNR